MYMKSEMLKKLEILQIKYGDIKTCIYRNYQLPSYTEIDA